MRVSYGIEVDEESIDYLEMAETVLAIFSDVFLPGKYLVETFPSLRFLPSWMPGAGFKRDGKAWTKAVYRLVEIPWKQTKEAMVRLLPFLFTAYVERPIRQRAPLNRRWR